MNNVEFQFFAVSELSGFASDESSFEVNVFAKGELLKSGSTRRDNAITFSKGFLDTQEIENVAVDFIKRNISTIIRLKSLLHPHGEAFLRVSLSAEFDNQVCSFNFSTSTLKILFEAGLALDVVVLEQ